TRDKRTPWYAKAFVACVVAYALSPIDLIPDPIPILGYLDDLLLLPIGIYLALKMIPEPVLAECRQKAGASSTKLPCNRIAPAIIIALWIAVFILFASFVIRFVTRRWRVPNQADKKLHSLVRRLQAAERLLAGLIARCLCHLRSHRDGPVPNGRAG